MSWAYEKLFENFKPARDLGVRRILCSNIGLISPARGIAKPRKGPPGLKK